VYSCSVLARVGFVPFSVASAEEEMIFVNLPALFTMYLSLENTSNH
jgi:hypothetical protein